MVTIVVGIHVTICLALIIVILLQQGKGAEIGAVFGGSSQTVFGASGAGNVMTKATWAMAAMFFATSIFLAYASTRRFTGSIFGSGGGIGHKVVYPAKPVMPSGPAGSAPAGSAPGASAPMTAPAAPAAPAKPVAPKNAP
ncbi:MAG TPA: preprotein translocase subunit SecG [Candidatus Binataceae bacterium]|nr:preprotein translocase subunit SecG [Candidatus Binataceae bacterium]